MSRRMPRNIAIIVAVGLVVGAVFGLLFDTSGVPNVFVGAAAGAIAVVIIDVIDRRRDRDR